MNLTTSSSTEPPESGSGPPARLSILGTTDLRASDGRALPLGVVQPKRLVLLSYLSLAPAPGYVRRDTLLALFWPELAADQARHALRQSLHYLRSGLGRELMRARGDTEIAVDPARLWCDARAFEERVAAHDPAGAMALYRGQLLEGVFVADAAPELEQWLDAERLRFRRMAATTAAELAATSDAGGDAGSAIAWARRAVAFDPDDERAVRALMELLDRHGDRAGALRAYAEFEQRLREEYDTAPSAQTRSLRARLGVDSPLPAPDVAALSGGGSPSAATAALPSGRDRARFRLGAAALILLAGIVAVLAFGSGRDGPRRSAGEVIAVGNVAVESGSGQALADDALALRAQLATDLSQLDGIAVLSEGRLYEMVARARGSMDARDHVVEAARRAGATELLDGVLRERGSLYRFELQRIELASGTVRGTLVIESARLADVAAQATSRMANAHRLAPPVRSLGSLTTQSPIARRSFERGMHALYAGDEAAALRQFSAALEVDPKFFAAAFHALGLTSIGELGDTLRLQVARAAAAADSAPERERLQIRTLWTLLTNDPRAVTFAESLATRYPADPEGRNLLGQALVHAGDFTTAIDELRAAIEADSILLDSAVSGAAPCRVCNAMRLVAQTYIFLDSMDAALRWVDAWRAASPGSRVDATAVRVVLDDLMGRRDKALAAVRDSLRPSESAGFSLSFVIESAIRAGDFAEAERLIARDLASGEHERRWNGLWWDIIYQHTRGRLARAVLAADRFCAEPDGSRDDCAQIRASVLSRVGRFREASAGLERRLRITERDSAMAPGLSARRRIWLMAQLADVRATARDTVGLARLADSMATIGRLSGYGRARRLHHYARGRLHAIRGAHARAAESFRAGEYGPTYSLGQIRYGWAHALLSLGRADEAVDVLDPLRRRILTSVGSYFSQAEVHLLLAQALAEAGHHQAAREELVWVERAWDGADPELRERLAAVRSAVSPP